MTIHSIPMMRKKSWVFDDIQFCAVDLMTSSYGG